MLGRTGTSHGGLVCRYILRSPTRWCAVGQFGTVLMEVFIALSHNWRSRQTSSTLDLRSDKSMPGRSTRQCIMRARTARSTRRPCGASAGCGASRRFTWPARWRGSRACHRRVRAKADAALGCCSCCAGRRCQRTAHRMRRGGGRGCGRRQRAGRAARPLRAAAPRRALLTALGASPRVRRRRISLRSILSGTAATPDGGLRQRRRLWQRK